MGRSAFSQPYTPPSIWNIPMGAGAVYANPQPTATQTALFPATIKTLTTDTNILLLDPSQALTNINTNTNSNRCFVGALLGTVPMPVNYQVNTGYSGGPTTSTAWIIPGSGSNNALAAVKADGITTTGGSFFARCSAGSPGGVTSLCKQSGSLFDAGLGTTTTTSDGPFHGGSGLSTIGGTLRLGDLVPGGTIAHALKINLDGGKNFFNGFVWPAFKKDSYTYSPGGTNPKLAPGRCWRSPPRRSRG